jgi:hypothetical protein
MPLILSLVITFSLLPVFCPGAGVHAPLNCTGSGSHYCDTASSVTSIDGVFFNDTVFSGRTARLTVDWTGWHYTDDNYWAFFLDSSLSPTGTCVSFVDDGNVNNTYTMLCSLSIPYYLDGGPHNLTLTANDAPGYCIPGEEGVDAQYTLEFNVSDPPVILRDVQCEENNSFWEDCSGIAYGDVLTRVRVNCTSLNSTLVSASFSLENMPDLRYFYLNSSNTSAGGGMLVYDNVDLPVEDSGVWNLTASCRDLSGESTTGSVVWEVPWGTLEGYLIEPDSSINASRHSFFRFSSGVRCLGGECGSVNATLDPESAEGGCIAGNTTPAYGGAYPLMRPDEKMLKEWLASYRRAREISADAEFRRHASATNGSSYSLLEHVNYIPVERNQGRCGNCWIWAGTGVMEVALDVQNGIFDRLSTQYINSLEPVLLPYKTCCNGGEIEDYAAFYNKTRRAVPWSNVNAYYQDGDGSCDTDYGLISTTPSYHISGIEKLAIPTVTVDRETAIANVKNVLHQDKAVWFAFYLPKDASWQDFFDFWRQQNESAVYQMDKFCNISYDGGGGHAVLLVGYNDTDPENPYWVMLNSWGATNGRSNVLFRISMDMQYNCTNPFPSFQWETLNVSFDFTENKGAIPENAGTPFYTTSSNPQACAAMKPGDSCNQTWTVNATGLPDTTWHFYTIYGPDDYPSYLQTALTRLINVTITAVYPPDCSQQRCTPSLPCYGGYGDCDSSLDCINSTCAFDVGLSYGCPRWVDMCMYSTEMSSSSSSSSSARSSSTSRITVLSSSSSSSSRIASTSSSVIQSSSSSSSAASSGMSSSSSSTSRTPTTTQPNCIIDRCTSQDPCYTGFGDCDSNQDCINSTCAFDVGLSYGCARWVDICV